MPGYRVERLLGVGSQAEVWLGRELATGDPVALKRIPAGTPEAVAACQAEAALLAALDHPNLIALRGCVPLDSALVLVLELAEAGTLAGLLDRRGRLTPPEVVTALSPVAAALAHAHGTGLLHGDVSAANILFTRAGRPKLADFGLARLLSAVAEPAETRDDADWLGTPAYLDPTIAAGGPAGLASDVFSLGAVALHALTGAGPWQTPGLPIPSGEQAVAAAATGTITGLAERLRVVPPDLAAVLTRALDPDPFRRGSAAELALDLGASLPSARVELTGGRIARQELRQQESRRQEAVMVAGGLDRVPLDVTRIAPPRPPADITALLRSGCLASDDAGPAARPGRLPGIRSVVTAPARWVQAAGRRSRPSAAGRRSRFSAAGGWRSRLGIRGWCRSLRIAGWRTSLGAVGVKTVPSSGPGSGLVRADPAPAAVPPGAASLTRSTLSTQGGERTRPGGRHRPSGQGGRGRHSPAMVVQRGRGNARRRDARIDARSNARRGAAGLVAAAVLAVACVVGWPHLHRRPADAATAHQAARRSSVSKLPGGSGAGSATAGGRDPDDAGIGTAAEAGRVLAGLAAIREQAYAQRRSDMLAGVYASATLLAADGQQLYRSVPSGCALIGVRTGYRDPQLEPTGQPAAVAGQPAAVAGQPVAVPDPQPADLPAGHPAESPARTGIGPVSIIVTASVPSATLRCGGVVRGRTRPAGPIRLRLVLSNSGQGWRISSERPG